MFALGRITRRMDDAGSDGCENSDSGRIEDDTFVELASPVPLSVQSDSNTHAEQSLLKTRHSYDPFQSHRLDMSHIPHAAAAMCEQRGMYAESRARYSRRSSSFDGPNNNDRPNTGRCKESAHLHVTKDGAGFTLFNKYKLLDDIGKGSYGIVKLAYNTHDRKLYVKKKERSM